MACPPSNVKFQLRRATSTNWTSTNPILQAGEPGFESDTYKLKIGDGTTHWNLLPYIGSFVGLQGPTGPQGVQGPQGPQGIAGQSFTLLGSYTDRTAFDAAVNAGYLIQYQATGNAYILLSDGSLMTWSTSSNTWFDAGDIKGPTGAQGVTGSAGPVSAYIFDGGNSTSVYTMGPAFDCGTSI